MSKITYAIGDIHGCLDELEALVDRIEAYHRRHSGGLDAKFVFLGDYVDRGPDSKGVIDFLIDLSTMYECVFLRGNHEDMLMYDPGSCWMNGGYQTFRSYGFNGDPNSIHSTTQVFEMWVNLVPEKHKKFFKDTNFWHRDEQRGYVHAGIYRWEGPFERQPQKALLWVRDQFLNDDSEEGGYIVHGHTPCENGKKPNLVHNRCNLDTGCCFEGGGPLSAGVFVESSVPPIHIIQNDENLSSKL